jgi:hypothetical protein
MWWLFGLLSWWLTRKSDDNDELYEPKYSGRWVERGEDNWEWVEKHIRKVVSYVNVYQVGDEFVICISKRPRPRAIDYQRCEDQVDVDNYIGYFKVHYEQYGTVTVRKDEWK